MRVSGQGQGSGWHAFESRRPLGGLLGRLLPQRVGEHAQRLELARRRRLGIGRARDRRGWARCWDAAHPSGAGLLLSSGPLSPQAPPLGPSGWPRAHGRPAESVRGTHGRLRAGALRPSVRWCLRRIARAWVIFAARPLRRARVAPILVTLHKLEVVRLRTANEVLLVEAQHPRLRCQRRRDGRAGLGRACRARVPSGSSPVLAAYGAAAWPTFNTQAVPALAGCRCRRTCACRAGMGQSACTG